MNRTRFTFIELILLVFAGFYVVNTIAAYATLGANPNIGQKMVVPALAAAVFIFIGMAFHIRGERIERER